MTDATSVAGKLDIAIESATADWWTHGALLAISQLARTGRGFDADQVIDMCGTPSVPHYLGAAFASAQRKGLIEAVGCRVGGGGRLLRVWWGVGPGELDEAG